MLGTQSTHKDAVAPMHRLHQPTMVLQVTQAAIADCLFSISCLSQRPRNVELDSQLGTSGCNAQIKHWENVHIKQCF